MSYSSEHPEQFEPKVSTLNRSELRGCKGCGEPTERGWCSPACYRAENNDDEMEG